MNALTLRRRFVTGMTILLLAGFAAILVPGLPACNNVAGKSGIPDTTYTLTGKIAGLDSGYVYLIDRQTAKQKVDTIRVQDGSFVFTGKAPSPELYSINLPGGQDKSVWTTIFLQNGSIGLRANKDSLSDEQILITGSQAQDELKDYNLGLTPLHNRARQLDSIYRTASAAHDQKTQDSVVKLFDGLSQVERDYLKIYVAKHPASYVSAYQVMSNYSYNPDAKELDSIYNKLDSTVRMAYFGKKIKEVLDAAKKTDIGQPAPLFTMNDANGKPIELASFKGKYLLVDFWASWCGPCRKENPNVVKAYQRFHNKGFQILGVSLDDDKTAWQEAVQKDHLTWPQVCDLRGWQNQAAQLYGIRGIPMNLLLDKDGKIIAKGLRGDALDKELESLFPRQGKG